MLILKVQCVCGQVSGVGLKKVSVHGQVNGLVLRCLHSQDSCFVLKRLVRS